MTDKDNSKEGFSRHPVLTTLLGGVFVSLVTFGLETYRERNNLSRQERQNHFSEFVKSRDSEIKTLDNFLNEIALESELFYSSVENFILDFKSLSINKSSGLYESRVWADIQVINSKRASLFTKLELLKNSGVDGIRGDIETFYKIIIKATEDCQSMDPKRVRSLRRDLDEKYNHTKSRLLTRIHMHREKIFGQKQ